MPGYSGPIEEQTLNNTYFRQVLFTGKHAQLVVMCLQPREGPEYLVVRAGARSCRYTRA